jgi:predicted TIM-barrel fold metal-dependent hydrolase
MDIVDGQVHVGHGEIEATLRAMDALGIRSLFIDELWGGKLGEGDPTHIQPGFRLPNGAWRTFSPTAEQASLLHPDRFSYLVRVDRKDPDLAALMRIIGSAPHARAVRVQPTWTMAEAGAFAEGAYDEIFALAGEHGLPVFLFMPGFAELLPRYLARFPQVTFVVDHCGMPFQQIPFDRPEAERARVETPNYFDEVLKLADYPNAALKWAHAPARFGVPDYPFEPLRPFLRRAISAFGPERIMWASDNSVIPDQTWSDLLHAIRDNPELTAEEKRWILGASARRILNWPSSE